jgi:hypothetical protein
MDGESYYCATGYLLVPCAWFVLAGTLAGVMSRTLGQWSNDSRHYYSLSLAWLATCVMRVSGFLLLKNRKLSNGLGP